MAALQNHNYAWTTLVLKLCSNQLQYIMCDSNKYVILEILKKKESSIYQ